MRFFFPSSSKPASELAEAVVELFELQLVILLDHMRKV
jgi:hypothetical protein